MTVVQCYETEETLLAPASPAAAARRALRCVVTRVVAARRREYAEGVVLTLVGDLFPDNADAPVGRTVLLNLYGAWAAGAGFVEVGDVVILRGIRVGVAPRLEGVDAPPDAAAAPTVVVTPLGDASELAAVQRMGDGSLMEVTVGPGFFDEPRVRGVRDGVTTSLCFTSGAPCE